MNKNILIGIIVLVVVVAAGGAYFFFGNTLNLGKPEKIYRVGVLSGLAFFHDSTNGFKSGMTKLGYIEGKNIFYDEYVAPAPVGNKAALQKFVDNKVDLILAYPTEASLEAKEVTKGTGIPIISLNVIIGDNGLVDSVQVPGGNLTGVRFPVEEIVNKRFEIAHQLFPNAKNYLVVHLKDYPTVVPSFAVLDPLAQAAGITITKMPFANPDEFIAFLESRKASDTLGADLILGIPEPLNVIPSAYNALALFARARALPVTGVSFLDDKDYGNIFKLVPNVFHVGELGAPLADKIFNGIAAGTIPIVTPESELELNYKAAKTLGVTIPESLLSSAVRIIK